VKKISRGKIHVIRQSIGRYSMGKKKQRRKRGGSPDQKVITLGGGRFATGTIVVWKIGGGKLFGGVSVGKRTRRNHNDRRISPHLAAKRAKPF